MFSEHELNDSNLDQKKVIQLLVHLVCQTMTHLLKSEVDQHNLKTELELIRSKYDELSDAFQNRVSHPLFTSTLPALAKSTPPPLTKTINPPANQGANSKKESEVEESPKLAVSGYSGKYLMPRSTQSTGSDLPVNHHEEEENEEEEEAEVSKGDNKETVDESRSTRNLYNDFKHASEEMPSFVAPSFTGSSPTDLLFAPNSLPMAPFNSSQSIQSPKQAPSQMLSTPPTRDLNKQQAAAMTPEREDYQYYLKLQQQALSNFETPRSVPDGDNDHAVKVGDSYDNMIQRLSYKFTDHLASKAVHGTPTAANTADAVTPLPKYTMSSKEEAPSIVYPQMDVPTPMQQPRHPFSSNISSNTKASSIVGHNIKKQLVFPIQNMTEKKIVDASYGSFTF